MPQNKPYSILFCTLLATTEGIAHWWENPVNYATGYLKTVSKTRYCGGDSVINQFKNTDHLPWVYFTYAQGFSLLAQAVVWTKAGI